MNVWASSRRLARPASRSRPLIQVRAAQTLLAEAPWRQSEVVMWGKPVMQPRRICYMADHASLAYSYTGAQMVGRATCAWPQWGEASSP